MKRIFLKLLFLLSCDYSRDTPENKGLAGFVHISDYHPPESPPDTTQPGIFISPLFVDKIAVSLCLYLPINVPFSEEVP